MEWRRDFIRDYPERDVPQFGFIVYPGTERFPFDDVTDAIGLAALAKALQSAR
jgi:hypothetical protein